jgi:hypothetical protein
MQSSINNYETQGISKACIARDQSSCEEEDMACVGENGANFVYQLTGNVTLWQPISRHFWAAQHSLLHCSQQHYNLLHFIATYRWPRA